MHVPIYLKKDMKVVTLKSQQWTQLLKVRMKVKNLNVNGTGSKDTNSPPWTRSQMMSFGGLFTMALLLLMSTLGITVSIWTKVST